MEYMWGYVLIGAIFAAIASWAFGGISEEEIENNPELHESMSKVDMVGGKGVVIAFCFVLWPMVIASAIREKVFNKN